MRIRLRSRTALTPPPTSEPVAEAQGARSPRVRRRRSVQPRPLDWNERLRRSLRGGTGETTWRT
jgi:hypothetical protein